MIKENSKMLETDQEFMEHLKQTQNKKKMNRFLIKKRQILCTFSISSHNLEIEKGMHYQIEIEKESVNCVMLK